MKPLTIGQVVNNLLPAVENHRLYAAILIFFTTGLRHGEVAGLRWADIDFTSGVLTVNQSLAQVQARDDGDRKTKLIFQQPKTETSRRSVPLSPDCISALKPHKARQTKERLLMGQAYQDKDLVFCREDGVPIAPNTMLRLFRQMLKQAGLPNIRLHDARHTFATLMLEHGE